jgi:GST-like protein
MTNRSEPDPKDSLQESAAYHPPKVWIWDKANGGRFANINRPIAGPTHESELPVGAHPLQLYSLGTPNGVKVTVMLEELLALGYTEAEYDAWPIRIGEGEQFGSGFVDINPNSKIPALVDRSGEKPVAVFESASILFYLAEKFSVFLPSDHPARSQCLSWLFWQMGSAPYLGGGFGHFYAYAPSKMEYPIDRFTMEVKRQMDVLDRLLEDQPFIVGDAYSIADMAIWPWYGQLALGRLYGAADFLDVESYKHLLRWAQFIGARPAVQRGRLVNKLTGDADTQVPERHSEADFQGKRLA